jgi:hypothetical protein
MATDKQILATKIPPRLPRPFWRRDSTLNKSVAPGPGASHVSKMLLTKSKLEGKKMTKPGSAVSRHFGPIKPTCKRMGSSIVSRLSVVQVQIAKILDQE